jgi:acid phosphatase type 7
MPLDFQRWISLILLVIFASACSPAIPAAEILLPTATTEASSTPLPTDTAASTNTPQSTPTATLTLSPTRTPSPLPSATPTPVVLVGAGDIAYCGEAHLGDEATADLLERFPQAHIFTAGDNVQGIGSGAEFRNCFGPSWGRFIDRIRPAPGNHDYLTDGGAPYYAYFGDAAGEAGLGYYSYDLGDWHIVALNSNCDDIACGPGSRQAEWLRADLEANAERCTLLYWHHPRWSSGLAGNYGSVSTFWRTAFEYGADIVVSGHDHHYERFAPMDGDGNPHPQGLRQFIVGTGGTYLRDFGEIKPHSEVRYNDGHGLIKFTLYPGRYEWEFIPVEAGVEVDSGSGSCDN